VVEVDLKATERHKIVQVILSGADNGYVVSVVECRIYDIGRMQVHRGERSENPINLKPASRKTRAMAPLVYDLAHRLKRAT
jgi:hypothetical protein